MSPESPKGANEKKEKVLLGDIANGEFLTRTLDSDPRERSERERLREFILMEEEMKTEGFDEEKRS